MEESQFLPLIAGFIGALIGALGSAFTIYIQQKFQAKRDKVKLASEMAMFNLGFMYKHAADNNRTAKIYPVSVFQYYHHAILTALESGSISADDIKEINLKRNELMNEIENLQKGK